ncbi:hypothetical protein JCM10213_007363 [Rhodosporidiobolus nylandii]
MLADRSYAAIRAARTGARNIRTFHVDNKVNNNLPFKYEGEASKRFTAGLVGAMSFALGAPFLVMKYQL